MGLAIALVIHSVNPSLSSQLILDPTITHAPNINFNRTQLDRLGENQSSFGSEPIRST